MMEEDLVGLEEMIVAEKMSGHAVVEEVAGSMGCVQVVAVDYREGRTIVGHQTCCYRIFLS